MKISPVATPPKSRRIVLLAAISVIALWVAALKLPIARPDQVIPMGDRASMVGALFTGLALVGLLWTSLLQREQLKAALDAADKAKKDSDEMRIAAQLNTRMAAINAFLTACHTRLELLGVEISKVESGAPYNSGMSSQGHKDNMQNREFLIKKTKSLMEELDTLYEQSKTLMSNSES